MGINPVSPASGHSDAKINRLGSEQVALAGRVAEIESLLRQYRPEPLKIKDQVGKLRRYDALARFGGTTLDLRNGSPFSIIDVSTEDQTEVTVYYASSLRPDETANTDIPISGLDEDGTGENGFSVALFDLIWLEITVVDDGVTDATIGHGVSWPGYPNPITIDGDNKQTKAYIAIGQIVEVADTGLIEAPGPILGGPQSNGAWMASQYVNTHLVMRNVTDTKTGQQAIYPIPSWAPVVGDDTAGDGRDWQLSPFPGLSSYTDSGQQWVAEVKQGKLVVSFFSTPTPTPASGDPNHIITIDVNKGGTDTTISAIRNSGLTNETYAEVVLKDDDASAWLYKDQAANKQAKLSLKDDYFKLWDESTGNTSEIKTDSITVSKADGSYSTITAGTLDLMTAAGKEIYLNPDDMTHDFAGMKSTGACEDGETTQTIDALRSDP